jgi:hypothetical protein
VTNDLSVRVLDTDPDQRKVSVAKAARTLAPE